MNSFEVIEKYLPQSVDKYFAQDAQSVILEKGTKFIDVNFNETGYVKIASILMDGLSDYYQTQQNSVDYVNPGSARPSDPANYAAYAGNISDGSRDGFRIGGMDVSWELFRLQWVRGKQFRIDYIANEETAGIIIGNALEEFHRLKVIPEVDTCRFSFLADQASVSLGNLVVEDLTAAPNTILAKLNAVFSQLFDMGVPVEQQVIFMRSEVMDILRNTTELTKFLTQGDYRSEAGLDFTVEKYMGRPIIPVSSDRFFTNVLLTQNGYRAQSSSKLINYMVVSTKASVPVRKLEYEKIYGPEMSGLAGFHGYLINYLLYHGMFVPRNKVPGIYVSLGDTAATTKVNLLKVDTRVTSGHNWTLRNFFTNPSGMRGTLVYSSSTLGDLGATITIDGSTIKALYIGDVVTETEATQKYYFGLVDASGTLIAKSVQVTVN